MNIKELIKYINESENFKANELRNVIQVFNNNKHLLYINTGKINQIVYTKYGNKDNRVTIDLKTSILTIYYTKDQYMFMKL